MKNALSLEKFEKARSLCTALRKAGHKKRRENAKNYRNLTGFFVDSFARFTISWYEGIAIERYRICSPLMFGFESHDSTGASHGSTAARTEPRCEGARSGRREHLPFCRWAARRALRLETRIDLTRAIETWYRAVESWVRFKVFFRWILEYKSKIFLLKMIVIYNNWNMYFIFIWKFFVQSNIKVVKFSWMCLSGRIMVPLLYFVFLRENLLYQSETVKTGGIAWVSRSMRESWQPCSNLFWLLTSKQNFNGIRIRTFVWQQTRDTKYKLYI